MSLSLSIPPVLSSTLHKIYFLFQTTPDLGPICVYGIAMITTILIIHLLNDMYMGTIAVGITVLNGVYFMFLFWLLTTINPATRTVTNELSPHGDNFDDTALNLKQSSQNTTSSSTSLYPNSIYPNSLSPSPTQTKPLLASTSFSKPNFSQSHQTTQSCSTQSTQISQTQQQQQQHFNTYHTNNSYSDDLHPDLDLQSLLLSDDPTQFQQNNFTYPPQSTFPLPAQPKPSHQYNQQQYQTHLVLPNTIPIPVIPHNPSTISQYTSFSPQNIQSNQHDPKTIYQSSQLLNHSFQIPSYPYNNMINQNQNNPSQFTPIQYDQPLPPPPILPSIIPSTFPSIPSSTPKNQPISTSSQFHTKHFPYSQAQVVPPTTAPMSSYVPNLPNYQPALTAQLRSIPQVPSQFHSTNLNFDSNNPMTHTEHISSNAFSPPSQSNISLHLQQNSYKQSTSLLSLTFPTPDHPQFSSQPLHKSTYLSNTSPISSLSATSQTTLFPSHHQQPASITSLYSSTDCTLCLTPQPARAYHCFTCRQCSHLQHHHCYLINNCIAKKNFALYFHFLLFLLFLGILIISITWYYFHYYVPFYNVPPPHYSTSLLTYSYLTLLSLILIIFSIQSLSQLIYTLFINLTVSERHLIRQWILYNTSKSTPQTLSASAHPSTSTSLGSLSFETNNQPTSIQNVNTNSPQQTLASPQQTLAYSQSSISLTDLIINQPASSSLQLQLNTTQSPMDKVDSSYNRTTTTHFLDTTHSSPFSPNSEPFVYSNMNDEIYHHNTHHKHTLPYQRHWIGALMSFFDLDIPFFLSLSILDVLSHTLFPISSSPIDMPKSSYSYPAQSSQQTIVNAPNPTLHLHSPLPALLPSSVTYKSKAFSSLSSSSSSSSNSTTYVPQSPQLGLELYTLWCLPLLSAYSTPTSTSSISNPASNSNLNISSKNFHSYSFGTKLTFTWLALTEWISFHFRWCFPLTCTIFLAPVYIFFHRALVWTDEMLTDGTRGGFSGDELI